MPGRNCVASGTELQFNIYDPYTHTQWIARILPTYDILTICAMYPRAVSFLKPNEF